MNTRPLRTIPSQFLIVNVSTRQPSRAWLATRMEAMFYLSSPDLSAHYEVFDEDPDTGVRRITMNDLR